MEQRADAARGKSKNLARHRNAGSRVSFNARQIPAFVVYHMLIHFFCSEGEKYITHSRGVSRDMQQANTKQK
jgi:hypothetical protein